MNSKEECLCSTIASMKSPWFQADSFIVVTGASRGFGRALCLQLVNRLTAEGDAASSIFMLLMARNTTALLETKTLLEKATSANNTTTSITVVISEPSLDMSEADEWQLRQSLEPLFNAYSTSSQSRRWLALVHNAGFLGDITARADQQFSVATLKNYFHGNLFSPIILTSIFLQHLAPLTPEEECSTAPTIVIVNIGSLAAEKALSHMSYYCTGKAARQMYYQCLSVDRPTVAVFNYSPGPLATDMYTELAEKLGNLSARAMCRENIEHGRVVEPEESARVCVDWLHRMKTVCANESPKAVVCLAHESKFVNVWQGVRLDYFDVSDRERL